MKPSDVAWREILRARGNVRGKVFVMSPDALQIILLMRGEHMPIQLNSRRIYGVPVQLDPRRRTLDITLEERR